MKPSVFLALTFAWTWAVAALIFVLALPLGTTTLPIAVFGASVGPVLFAWAGGILPPLGRIFRFTNVVAWISPVALVWLLIGICDLIGVAKFDLSGAGLVERVLVEGGDPVAVRALLAAPGPPPAVVASLRALVLTIGVFGPLALAEEVVWRGVVFGWLRTPWPLFGRWATAGLWAFWITPTLAMAGQLWQLAAYFPLGVALVGLRERSGGVLAPALARGAFWAVVGIDAMALGPADPRFTSPFGTFAFVVLLVAAVTAGRWNHARTLGLGASPTVAEE